MSRVNSRWIALVLAKVTIRMYDLYMVGLKANISFTKPGPANSTAIIKKAHTSDTRQSGSGGAIGEL